MYLLYGSDIADARGIAQDSFRLSFDGVRLNPDDQPKGHGMEAGDPDGHVSQLLKLVWPTDSSHVSVDRLYGRTVGLGHWCSAGILIQGVIVSAAANHLQEDRIWPAARHRLHH